MADEILNINAEVTGTESIRNMRQELKELKGQLLTLPQDTDAYAQALKRAADIADNMADTNLLVKNSAGDLDQVFGNVAKVSSQLVGGFGAVTAGMQLLGIENESVIAGMAKLQQITAIASGLEGLSGLGKNFKALKESIKSSTVVQWAWNAAQSANPIALVIVGVVALTAAVYGLTKAFEDSISETDKVIENMKEIKMLSDITQDSYANEIEIMQANGAKASDITRKKAEAAQALHKSTVKELEDMYKLRDSDDLSTKEWQENNKKIEEAEKSLSTIKQNLRVLEINGKKQVAAENKEANDKIQKDNEDATKKNLDNILAGIQAKGVFLKVASKEELDNKIKEAKAQRDIDLNNDDLTKNQRLLIKKKYQKEVDDLKENFKKAKEEEAKAASDAAQALMDARKKVDDFINDVTETEIDVVKKKYADEWKAFEEANKKVVDGTQLTAQQMADIKIQYEKKASDEIIKINEKTAEEKRKLVESDAKALKAAQDDIANNTKSSQQLEIDAVKQKYSDQYDALVEANNAKNLENKLSDEKLAAIKFDLETQSAADIAEINRQAALEKANTIIEAGQATMDAANAINDFIGALNQREIDGDRKKTNEKIANLDLQLKIGKISQEQYAKQKEQIEYEFDKKKAALELKAAKRKKALALIQAGIDTATAVISALSTTPAWLGIALSIAAGITGAANIAAIAATPISVNEAATPTVTPPPPSIPTSSAPLNTPSPNVPMAAGQNQIQYVRQFRDTSTTELQPATKVYVLESDITSKQNEVSVAENESTF